MTGASGHPHPASGLPAPRPAWRGEGAHHVGVHPNDRAGSIRGGKCRATVTAPVHGATRAARAGRADHAVVVHPPAIRFVDHSGFDDTAAASESSARCRLRMGARPFAKRRPVVSIAEGRGRSSRGTPPPSTERRPHYAMKFCKY